jgi:plastocyanin
VSHLVLAAAAYHDKSKTPFFIAAGVLVCWALLVSALGIRSTKFPASKLQGRAAIAISVVLVVVTGAMAVVTSRTPPPVPPYSTGVTTNGIGPAFTPVSANGVPATPTSGPLKLSANPKGLLAFNTKALASSTSHVVIDFTNSSPLPHNVTVANSSGKVLGATPTFSGGTRTLTLNLPPGTYTFYCSVPGHEAAGMKGTLTVSGSSAPAAPTPTNGPLKLSADPTGQLAFNTTTLAAATSHVVIDFTNSSPLPHNVTVANSSGKVLGATPTFAGGTKTLTLTLPPGTYTYYCSVPGHEAAGMKGTLTVH